MGSGDGPGCFGRDGRGKLGLEGHSIFGTGESLLYDEPFARWSGCNGTAGVRYCRKGFR